MARKVVWTQSAWRDLEQIADYIAKDSPAYAASFVGHIRERASSLDQLGWRSRAVPEVDDPNIRELLVGNYRLIVVLALIHGARDLATLWGLGEPQKHELDPQRAGHRSDGRTAEGYSPLWVAYDPNLACRAVSERRPGRPGAGGRERCQTNV